MWCWFGKGGESVEGIGGIYGKEGGAFEMAMERAEWRFQLVGESGVVCWL